MRHLVLLTAAMVAALGRVTWPTVNSVRWAMVPLLALLLTACSTRPEPPPEPPPQPAPVLCAAPAGMTAPEPEPVRPADDATQRDVAGYVTELHRWGSRGWQQLKAVRHHGMQCAENQSDELRE